MPDQLARDTSAAAASEAAGSTFADLYPELHRLQQALARQAEQEGPLDEHTRQLVRLALAIGSGAQNSVRAQTARALRMGIPREAIRHVVALTLPALGSAAAISAAAWTNAEMGRTVT